jgi:uncharacterized protein YqhQ
MPELIKDYRMNKQFNYGGQAVLEGVMMRGSRNMAVAVRAPYGYYKEAMQGLKETYSDIDLNAEPVNVAEIISACHIPEFDQAISKEGAVIAVRIPDAASLDLAAREDVIQQILSAGVHAVLPIIADESALTAETAAQIRQAVNATHDDLVLILADIPRIIVHEEPLTSPLYNGSLSKIPFVRGLGLLWDSLGLGVRALNFSADIAVGEEAEFGGPVAWGTMLVSFSLAIGLFFLLPAVLADWLHGLLKINQPIYSNLIEGGIRLTLIIGYIWAIGRIPDIQRLFGYHGAEHKAINAYEASAPLTPESVARFPLEHPRCGTGFLLVVVIISILIFSLLGRPPLILRLISRVVLIPVVAGVAYEYIRLLARNLGNPIARVLVKPQLWLQRLTTQEPSHQMLEVSICALRRVLESEQLAVSEPAGEPAAVAVP